MGKEHPTKIRERKKAAEKVMFCALAEAHPVLKKWAHAVQEVLGCCADSTFGCRPRLDLAKAKHSKDTTSVPIMGIRRGLLTRSRLRKTGRVYIRENGGHTTITIHDKKRRVAWAYMEQPQRDDMYYALVHELRSRGLVRKPGLD